MPTALILFSVLFPTKGWFAPDQHWEIAVKPPANTTVQLVLTDFAGSTMDADPGQVREFSAEGKADLKALFPALRTSGVFILYAVPQGERSVANFVGTPLVVSVREDRRRGAPAGPMVVKVDPMRYAIISTDAGDMTLAFYYDVASTHVTNFISLATGNFYDGLNFHRVESDFLIQGGDPRGDGTGGPGYTIDAEFSDRKHEEGVVSMARNIDPNESPNNPPRAEYANSAGSQFFICLNYKNTQQLDGEYTVFGRIVGPSSMETLRALAATPVVDKKAFRPEKPPVIKKIEIRPVTSKENPYRVLLTGQRAAEQGQAVQEKIEQRIEKKQP